MPFFANIGIGWPWLDQSTRKLGSEALLAGAGLLHLIAQLEIKAFADDRQYSGAIFQTVNLFESIARDFYEMVNSVPIHDHIKITSDSLEEAGVTGADDLVDDGELHNFEIDRGYALIAESMQNVADTLSRLKFDQSEREQARIIAASAQSWERAHRLGRIIGVVTSQL